MHFLLKLINLKIMSILLTSNGWKDNEEIKKEFLALFPEKNPSKVKVLLVNTATKENKEWKYVEDHIQELKKIGIIDKNITVFSLDKKVKAPFEADVIYVCGGNTFEYLDKIKKTNLDEKIKEMVNEGVHYFGISAGSILAGPEISIAIVGPEDSRDQNSVELNDLTGLNLTNAIIYPHYEEKEDKYVSEFEKRKEVDVFRVRDDQALLIKKEEKKLIGS